MTYHWHDDEFDWCPCDEDEEGLPIRIPAQKKRKPRNRIAERRRAERRSGDDRRQAS